MAKGQFLSGYQKGIVKRYYEHQDDRCSQKLGEIVSDLYLETNPAKVKRLWESADAALRGMGANPARTSKIIAEKNLPALAKLVEEMF
jgi:ABC-type nitrate/sulfonate/bicarbonate transport system substrate-binding protein